MAEETDRDKATEQALMATRVAVSSSLLKSIGPYAEGALDVEFNTGHSYRYTGISVEHYYGLLKADSPGNYFNKFIKTGCASCEKVPPPAEAPTSVDSAAPGDTNEKADVTVH